MKSLFPNYRLYRKPHHNWVPTHSKNKIQPGNTQILMPSPIYDIFNTHQSSLWSIWSTDFDWDQSWHRKVIKSKLTNAYACAISFKIYDNQSTINMFTNFTIPIINVVSFYLCPPFSFSFFLYLDWFFCNDCFCFLVLLIKAKKQSRIPIPSLDESIKSRIAGDVYIIKFYAQLVTVNSKFSGIKSKAHFNTKAQKENEQPEAERNLSTIFYERNVIFLFWTTQKKRNRIEIHKSDCSSCGSKNDFFLYIEEYIHICRGDRE